MDILGKELIKFDQFLRRGELNENISKNKIKKKKKSQG